MSGGPIFGFRFRKGGAKVAIVAVQSRCYEPSMTILGSRVSHFIKEFNSAVMAHGRSRGTRKKRRR
jgi:hypothetical protein